MDNKLWYRPLIVLLMIALAIVACDTGNSNNNSGNGGQSNVSNATATPDVPANAIQIEILYSPEVGRYLTQAMDDFNQAYREGRNPLTGQSLANGEKPIFVTGRSESAGTVMQGIANAFIAPNNENVLKPTVWIPSVSHWLALANYQAGRQIIDLTDSPATANAPVVIAIWESRLQALQRAHPDDQIGWSHLLEVLHNPEGWAAYGISGERTTVYYGHTDPNISSTALSTLIAEYTASAQANGIVERRLSLETVRNPTVQQGVRDIEALIRHYSRRTTEFLEYITQGPAYLDFVALEENDIIYINQGKTDYKPPERLVALYPAEGTFWHEHPYAIPDGDWITDEQKAAALVFRDYVLSPVVQEKVLETGFRPVNPDVPMGYPFVAELGVDPNQPLTVLQVPEPEVIAAVQESWSFVKKQADIWLLIDVSGSMYGDKIDQAKQAAIAFVERTDPSNRVGLMVFSSTVREVVPLDNVESNRARLIENINALDADGDTALYDALIATVEKMKESEGERIRAVVLLSDGADTASSSNRSDVSTKIEAERSTLNPVIVIPIAYGSDADVGVLTSIGRASNTKVQSGDPDQIQQLLELISSYF